jgi:hypothetical protein
MIGYSLPKPKRVDKFSIVGYYRGDLLSRVVGYQWVSVQVASIPEGWGCKPHQSD